MIKSPKLTSALSNADTKRISFILEEPVCESVFRTASMQGKLPSDANSHVTRIGSPQNFSIQELHPFVQVTSFSFSFLFDFKMKNTAFVSTAPASSKKIPQTKFTILNKLLGWPTESKHHFYCQSHRNTHIFQIAFIPHKV